MNNYLQPFQKADSCKGAITGKKKIFTILQMTYFEFIYEL